jgi:hypothetical protein
MGTTPILLLPYPELIDQANVPADMKKLADKIDATSIFADTGWINLTPVSGSGQFQYRSYARTVWMRASISGMTSIPQAAIGPLLAAGVLPAAYRPAISVYQASSMAGALSGLVNIGTDGSVGQWNNTGAATTVCRFTASWPKEGS